MKILHCITGLDRGGAQIALVRLLSRLDRARFACRVVSLVPGGDLAPELRGLGLELDDLGMRRGRPSARGLLRLIRIIREFKPDLVQTWLYHADLLGLAAAGLAGRVGVVWNLRCSNMDFSRYSRFTAWTVRACALLSGRPRAVLANSESARARHLALGYRPRRFEVIPNGFDLERFRPDPLARAALRGQIAVRPDQTLVGLAARFDPMKDHASFLRAARILAAERPEVRFALCGRGVDRDNAVLRAWIEEAGLADSCSLLGEVRDMPGFFAALDLAVSSSLGEGFPNAVGEAMACGVPCAVTDAGDSALLVGDTGLVAPPGDPSALAEAMGRLLDLPGPKLRDLGLRARARIRDHYSLAAMASAYEAFYLSLAGN
ncbi:MAG: glycosyltransferase [Desulfovibrionaceae bacterium]|nr:glycosyltransferase [Desulfovibrionaceae bacterium]